MKKRLLLALSLCLALQSSAQNSLVENGFGGRLWYRSYNYTVGSYSAYTVCGAEKQLYGWGSNEQNQLGNSTVATGTTNPVKVTYMDSVKYYSTGYVMGAIKENGSGWIWGSNSMAVHVLDDVFFVDAGINSCAFVKTDGTVWSVGTSINGEFGNGIQINPPSYTPIQMKNISNAVRTAQGYKSTCVLLQDGMVYCAGTGAAVGNGDANAVAYLPVQALGLKDIVDIKANTVANLALDKRGDLWIWGASYLGLGPNISYMPKPTKIQSLSNIISISGCNDGFHFLALDKDSNCYGWGRNYWGALGYGPIDGIVDTPHLLATQVVEIMAGETFSYIIKGNGSMWATGESNYGSIWMDLPNIGSNGFLEIHPEVVPMNLCKPIIHSTAYQPPFDSTNLASNAVLSFPTAFSPNGDGRNEQFKALIKSGAIIENYRLAIYNRWGQCLYKTTKESDGWDGKWQGIEQPIETYFYLASYNTPNRRESVLRGDFTLVR